MFQNTFLDEAAKSSSGEAVLSNSKKKLPELKLTPNALNVLKKRYLKHVSDKETEEPEEMLWRVADNISLAEKIYDPSIAPEKMNAIKESFYSVMARLEFLPNSPTLMNAGRDLQQLSACFVLPIEDSMDGIFDAIKNAALIHKSGGGTGFSFSRLRPKDDKVKTTGGVASGPISFMKVFNAATEAVKQGGTRRGANMGMLRVDHPDIMEFITAKSNTKELTNFNLSVALTDKFMDAVAHDGEYDLINPKTKVPMKKMKARDVFSLIVDSAWKNGEPGVIFIDKVNRHNPTPELGEIESTNPCGEQPLLPYEACNLGSINLARFVVKKSGKPEIDWSRLKEVTHVATRFLDDVIDMNKYPLEQIDKMVKGNRKIGLGVMGFSDMLIEMGIAYNSDAGLEVGEKVMKYIDDESKKASANLVRERGPFPTFTTSVFAKQTPLRNATTTTIAPTGTLSIIANSSGGIEPLFAVSFVRTILDNTKMIEVNPIFERIAKERGFYTEDLMKEIAKSGSLHGVEGIPEDIKKIFVTAHDIEPEWHVKMQSAFQKHTDNAVSKTINFGHSATKDDVRMAYMLAYKAECKGLTVYRDGSRDEQVLSTGSTEHGAEAVPAAALTKSGHQRIMPRPRPSVTRGKTQKMSTGCGSLYVTINEDEHGMCEVFAQMGKSGGCAASQSEATSRLISLSLRSGIDIDSIMRQIKGIRCPSPLWDKGSMVLSCPDAIAKAIEGYLAGGKSKAKDGSVIAPADASHGGNGNNGSTTKDLAGICPECESVLEYVEGCVLCKGCGYSKCG